MIIFESHDSDEDWGNLRYIKLTRRVILGSPPVIGMGIQLADGWRFTPKEVYQLEITNTGPPDEYEAVQTTYLHPKGVKNQAALLKDRGWELDPSEWAEFDNP
jgi:hypothetical protein